MSFVGKSLEYGSDVFRSLMDLGFLLEDGDQMVALRVFLGGIAPENPSLEKLHEEILAFTARIRALADAAQKQVR